MMIASDDDVVLALQAYGCDCDANLEKNLESEGV